MDRVQPMFTNYLRYEDFPVESHQVSFRISRVWASNGEEVQPTNGVFSGYGSICTTQGISDEAGIAYGTFTAGTIPGTIEFEATDQTMLVKKLARLAALQTVIYVPPQIENRKQTQQGKGTQRDILTPLVTFLRVSDNAGHETTRTSAQIEPILKRMNEIWLPQAQIKFFRRAWLNVEVNKNLGQIIDIVKERNGIVQATTTVVNANPNERTAHIYCHFVWRTQVNGKETIGRDSLMGASDVYCVDTESYSGHIIAHEVGHRFNVTHTIELDVHGNERPEGIKFRKHLMYPVLYGTANPWLSKTQADTAYARCKQVVEGISP